ncbi:hypothetical protein HRbin36_02440 [bacterium HR36]|nr:hypothetical protein HRbin36_02440 [bacterium HR36]
MGMLLASGWPRKANGTNPSKMLCRRRPTAGAALAVLLFCGVVGSEPPAGPVFMNERQIPIPIQCEQPELIERLQLFVSADQGQQWQLYASVPASEKEVMFVAAADGIYWFDLVAHFRDGRVEPKAPGTRPPLLVLYVDTKPPRVTLRPMASVPGEAAVQWEIEDEYLDLRTFQLEYRDPQSGNWTPLAVLPSVARGEKRWPVPGGGRVQVRLRVMDLAENVGQAQAELSVTPAINVASGPTAATPNLVRPVANSSSAAPAVFAPPPPPPPPAPVNSSSATVAPMPTATGTGYGYPSPVAFPATNRNPPASSPQGPQGGSSAGPITPGAAPPFAPNPTSPTSGHRAVVAPPTNLPAEATTPRVIARSDTSGLPTTEASWDSSVAPASASTYPPRSRGQIPGLRFLNTTRASLQYEVSRVGPSGVGSVELWMTRDDGRTWFKAGDDPDLQPPMLIEFPGEGVYGLTLVVRSRVGLGRAAPQPGEPPELRVEVDVTPPYAELYAVEADPQRRDTLVLLWSATDKNLAANPITLKWAERESGPWHVIASDLPNTGRYLWKMPDNLPYMVYLRLEVRDLAGNLAIAQTPKPVLVDLQEPEVKVLDITPPEPNR